LANTETEATPLRRATAPPNGVTNVEPRAALDQEPHHRFVARKHCLMQRSRVGVDAVGVIAVRVLACVEQQVNNCCMPVLRP
jgi:hypothetical protein